MFDLKFLGVGYAMQLLKSHSRLEAITSKMEAIALNIWFVQCLVTLAFDGFTSVRIVGSYSYSLHIYIYM